MAEKNSEIIQGGGKQDNFQFYVSCEVCGRRFYSKKILWLRLWPKRYLEKIKKLQTELIRHRSKCNACGRMVCDDCFVVADEGDFCISCAKEKRLKGHIVGRTPETRRMPVDFTGGQRETG